jgi:hypothetical protein
MFSHFLDSIPAGIFGCVLNPVEEENSLLPCSSANLFERGWGGGGRGRGGEGEGGREEGGEGGGLGLYHSLGSILKRNLEEMPARGIS